MKRQALAIIHTFISSLGVMSGHHQQQAKDLIQPHLEGFMQQFLAALSQPLTQKAATDWGIRMEAVKSLVQIMLHFSRFADTNAHNIVPAQYLSCIVGSNFVRICVGCALNVLMLDASLMDGSAGIGLRSGWDESAGSTVKSDIQQCSALEVVCNWKFCQELRLTKNTSIIFLARVMHLL